MSGGTKFCQALEEALAARNSNYRQDVRAIEQYINSETGFRVLYIKVERESDLTLKMVAKAQ